MIIFHLSFYMRWCHSLLFKQYYGEEYFKTMKLLVLSLQAIFFTIYQTKEAAYVTKLAVRKSDNDGTVWVEAAITCSQELGTQIIIILYLHLGVRHLEFRGRCLSYYAIKVSISFNKDGSVSDSSVIPNFGTVMILSSLICHILGYKLCEPIITKAEIRWDSAVLSYSAPIRWSTRVLVQSYTRLENYMQVLLHYRWAIM